MNPYVLAGLLFSIGLGTFMTLTSSHWFLAWMGLEINTLAIIPLMTRHHHPRAVEATIKYFLVQATAASTILFASTMNAWITGQWEIQQMTHPIPTTIITLALALKMGLAPLHSWFPEVLQGLDLMTGLLMSTLQKLAPFALMLQLQVNQPTLMVLLGICSTLMGGWGGLNQTQIRKILAYSSIAHLGWMILVMQYSPQISLMTLLMYYIMTGCIFLILKHNKATNINALATSSTTNTALSATVPLVLLSLAGLPPLTGFAPKWMILQELTKQELPAVATLTALSALLSLYFYLRLSYAITLTIPPNTTANTLKWRLNMSSHTATTAILTTATLLLLPLMPAALALLNM
uniref:NADH-ubiquinone oxidoreductase chain 2 n=1 Tax=Neobythites unimaculatus TaxID=1188027 RepID=A0A7I6NCX4_9TELE|nr:NADH dehydrogenase subunit 2 [Neobythites unimaculatus]